MEGGGEERLCVVCKWEEVSGLRRVLDLHSSMGEKKKSNNNNN